MKRVALVTGVSYKTVELEERRAERSARHWLGHAAALVEVVVATCYSLLLCSGLLTDMQTCFMF